LVVDDEAVQQLVFIPRDSDGVTISDDWDGFGQRVTGSGSVRFDRVEVRAEWIIPFQTSFERPTPIGPLAQILHAAIDLGIGQAAFDAALPFIRARARPWLDAGVERAGDDPLTLRELGDVGLRLRAAGALLKRAGRAVDAAIDAANEHTVAEASLAVAAARALTTTAGLLAANKLFELTGTSATMAEDGLDRHWRNIRTHSLHDPLRWKYHAIGNHRLNGINPPRHGAI
jgi:alkylation response protein AidB-like acyl-CoA dehydrogenase